MQYFFVLGNNPALSVAEITTLFPNKTYKLVNFDIFLMETEEELKPLELIKRLGGTIKIGKIHKTVKTWEISDVAVDIINKSQKIKQGEKFNFGFSCYGSQFINTNKIGLEIKKEIKEFGVNARLVVSRDKTLSSVVVEQNKLISRGIEIDLIPLNKNELYIGETLAVQPFKELSYRDYGRPTRDDFSGMIPPKLAQIMINLANPKNDGLILDPFCGSGTVLTELMLMGYKNLIGSDISDKAVSDTRHNLVWIDDKFLGGELKNKIQVYELSATELTKKFKANTIDTIVTEPYLGPQRGFLDFKAIVRELEDLYSRALSEFNKILKKDGKIVMIWPCFNDKNLLHRLNPNFSQFKIINPLPKNLLNPNLKLTNRDTIIYGRSGQKVWREIVVLEKR
jgi:tRNA G10  N-methylase Trm11